MGTLALLTERSASAVAGPLVKEDFVRMIPLDKKLDPVWLRSLTARGESETFRAPHLSHIGMPVGGLFSGTMYLGGDGRLWLWDIFNSMAQGIEPAGVEFHGKHLDSVWGSSYVAPLAADKYRRVEQGFEITVKTAAGEIRKTLDAVEATGFRDVSFTGEYPIGVVRYVDPALPVTVKLEAFSPFIPLNVKDSSLPATIFRFEVTNEGKESSEVTVTGHLENAVLSITKYLDGTRHRHTQDGAAGTVMGFSAALGGPNPETRPDIRLPDAGSMALALVGVPAEVREADLETPFGQKLIGRLGRKFTLAAGETRVVSFILAWHFPNGPKELLGGRQHAYTERFADAPAVARSIAEHFEALSGQTRLWRDTWYDSTLPYWFLNRTFANTSILATRTCYYFAGDRFWAHEGVGCCPGTCTHVWHYAQAMARLFPKVERDHREFVDFGLALKPDGTIAYRAENGDGYAVDGQAGRILGALRESQMSPDAAFLRRVWPNVKKALQKIITTDADGDGIIRGPLHNTLDADWYGVVPWLCNMYHAALMAGETMARQVDDEAFAADCRAILQVAAKNLHRLTWNEDFGYFVHVGDPARGTEVGAYDGCHIDQVLGQSWAWQVGLGEVTPQTQARKALQSIWNYNFTPDVAGFRAIKKEGRWYALAGDGGTIMLSNPFAPDINFTGPANWSAMYFNECMSGFEHQFASHLLWEKMVTEGLAVTRVIHDRYSAKLRNPYNEIECSDHYARAMASYGTFVAACGFEYDGPRQHIGFAPRITPEDFGAPFTAAEGWGTFRQKIIGGKIEAALEVKWGKLPLRSVSLEVPGSRESLASVKLDGVLVASKLTLDGNRITITFEQMITIGAGQALVISA
jgi:uncharacterized protein (DUF608 family)